MSHVSKSKSICLLRRGPGRAALLCGALATGALFPTDALADTTTLVATGDTTIFDSSPPNVSNGAGAYMFAGTNANGQARRALLRFDLGSLPASAVVQTVRLRLYLSQANPGSGVLTLHRLLADWGEGGSDSGGNASGGGGGGATATPGDSTWERSFVPDTSWIALGGDFAATASATHSVAGDGFYEWTGPGLAEDVRQHLSTPSANYGWLLRGEEAPIRSARRFNTRENPELSTRPVLIVEYQTAAPTSVPVAPWSMGLLGLALSALGVRKRARDGATRPLRSH